MLQCALCSVAKCSNLGVLTSKYLNQDENYGHFRQYRRRIAFCVLLCLFRSIRQSALCSDRKKNLFGRLNVDRCPTGRKLRTFVDNIVEGLRFAGCWAFFEAYNGVHYVLTVRCSNLGANTSKYLNRDGSYGHFSSKSTNDSVLRVVGLVSKHNTACTMF
jgi:hypothetical protein